MTPMVIDSVTSRSAARPREQVAEPWEECVRTGAAVEIQHLDPVRPGWPRTEPTTASSRGPKAWTVNQSLTINPSSSYR